MLDLLERALGASSAASGALCLLTAGVIWFRVIAGSGARDATASDEARPAVAVDLILKCLALILTIVAVRYAVSAGWWLDWLQDRAASIMGLAIVCDAAVLASALAIIRETTYAICGNRAAYIFAGGSLGVGVAVFTWG